MKIMIEDLPYDDKVYGFMLILLSLTLPSSISSIFNPIYFGVGPFRSHFPRKPYLKLYPQKLHNPPFHSSLGLRFFLFFIFIFF